jgi:Beta-lactamase
MLLALGACVSLPKGSAADEEAVYMQRYRAQERAAQTGGGLSDYDPLENVAGARAIMPLPSAAPDVALASLTQARDFAAARDSSAFLVWHKGALIEETYFTGFRRDAPINAKSLAKPLTAILIGRAIAQGHIKSLDQPVADFITEWKNDPRKPGHRIFSSARISIPGMTRSLSTNIRSPTSRARDMIIPTPMRNWSRH